MGLLFVDIGGTVDNAIEQLHSVCDKGSSEHELRIALAAVRTESRNWRSSNSIMDQVRKLVIADNIPRAIKLLQQVPRTRFRFF